MMRSTTPIAALCGVLALSACATRPPSAQRTPAVDPMPATIAKQNRFEMSQNGQRMSAEDFDAWMTARGIRIAKGKPSSKSAQPPKPPRKR